MYLLLFQCGCRTSACRLGCCLCNCHVSEGRRSFTKEEDSVHKPYSCLTSTIVFPFRNQEVLFYRVFLFHFLYPPKLIKLIMKLCPTLMQCNRYAIRNRGPSYVAHIVYMSSSICSKSLSFSLPFLDDPPALPAFFLTVFA